MKLHITIMAVAAAVVALHGCNERKAQPQRAADAATETTDTDSTVYGICGDGTSMHTLQLITDAGDTLDYELLDSQDREADVQGGLMAGDRMAVMGKVENGTNVASRAINLTTLLGRWSSIDKDFVIEEGGTVKSNIKAENNSWISWKIHNGKLLLNKDTFSISVLGADSLFLENDRGIFTYKRQKSAK